MDLRFWVSEFRRVWPGNGGRSQSRQIHREGRPNGEGLPLSSPTLRRQNGLVSLSNGDMEEREREGLVSLTMYFYLFLMSPSLKMALVKVASGLSKPWLIFSLSSNSLLFYYLEGNMSILILKLFIK